MSAIRVLLAEDHTIVREGLRLLLSREPDITVVAEAANGQQSVTAARKHLPDIVIMDISMPDMDGLEATRIIRAEHPAVQVLILTMHESDEFFFRALEAGAAGYIVKKAAMDDLVSGVRNVARGGAVLYPSMAKKLIRDYVSHVREAPEAEGYASLSDREREVFFLLAKGLTNQQIADQLVISPSTVQTHRSRIMQKLGLQVRADLVRYAIRHGLIEP